MTIVKHSIDAETAEKAVAAAAKKAAELKLKMCIAVSDEAGDLKAFARMDGAPKLSIEIATRTRPTPPRRSRCRPTPGSTSSRTIRRSCTASPIRRASSCSAADFPITLKGEIVGAIGLSGGHYSQDMECARAALARDRRRGRLELVHYN